MDLNDLHLIILPILLLSMTIRTTVGFGEALIAMPLLTMTVGLDLASPLVSLNSTVLSAAMLIQSFDQIEFRSIWRLLVGGAFGIPAGLLLLAGPFDAAIQIALGALVLGFAVWRLRRPTQIELKTEQSAFAFGFASGVLSGMYNTGGPPLVIYGTLRRWPPERFRVTLQGFFFPTSLMVSVGHGVAGHWSGELFVNFLAGLPIIVGALYTGKLLTRHLPPGRFDRLVYALLIVIGLTTIGRTLYTTLSTP